MKLKLVKLETTLRKIPPFVIAFTGGVDSSFLAAFALNVLSGNCLGITAVSEFLSGKEQLRACHMAESLGLPHELVKVKLLNTLDVVENSKTRCYHCKQLLFSAILEKAEQRGFLHVVHGANMDDLDDYRPGMAAAGELGVLSPLVDAGLTKADIRRASRNMGLESWNYPSQSCLASRIPYGERITGELLGKIEQGETVLSRAGFSVFRLRAHGEVARIEIDPREMPMFLESPLRLELIEGLKEAGFQFVALDLEGYISGSMNRHWP